MKLKALKFSDIRVCVHVLIIVTVRRNSRIDIIMRMEGVKKILWVVLMVMMQGVSDAVWLETYMNGTWKISEDTQFDLPLSLRFNNSDLEDIQLNEISLSEAVLEVMLVPDEDWKLDFVNRTVQFSGTEVLEEVNKSLVFSGYYWGRTHLAFYLIRDDLHPEANVTLLRDDLEVQTGRQTL